MNSTEFSLKIYEEILEFSKENNISFRKISRDINVKYTTFMTWMHTTELECHLRRTKSAIFITQIMI